MTGELINGREVEWDVLGKDQGDADRIAMEGRRTGVRNDSGVVLLRPAPRPGEGNLARLAADLADGDPDPEHDVTHMERALRDALTMPVRTMDEGEGLR